MMYGQLCMEFYNADKQFASDYELKVYQETFSKQDRILEPMCGSGRLSIPLLKLGYQVEGFDSSPHMLASCQRRAELLGLTPILHQTSIKNFSSRKLYHAIIIPLGSFQILYPREAALDALEKFNALLVVGGKLILDLFIPWESLYQGSESCVQKREITLESGETIKINNYTITNKFEQHMLSKAHYAKYSHGNFLGEEEEQMDILWYYPHEIQLMLEKYGFVLEKQISRFLNGSDHITILANLSHKKIK